MKGREHENIAKGLVVIFVIFFIFLLIFPIPILNWLVVYFGVFWFAIALMLFVLGSILPDSDSNDMGSYVYFKKVFGIAYFFKGLEFPIARLLKRERGHRQSLHTLSGIALTSSALMILLSIVAKFFNLFELKGAILGFIFLFLGQLLHLICDIQDDWKIRLT